jgi:hypothetical protein
MNVKNKNIVTSLILAAIAIGIYVVAVIKAISR